MKTTVIYTWLSHTCELIETQVALFRMLTRNLSRIVVVQGPFGANPLTSAGSVRLKASAAEGIGVDIVELPETIAGHLPIMRFNEILRETFSLVDRQSEPYAILAHGDLMPVRPVDAELLLNGSPVAGRGLPIPRLVTTWFAVDVAAWRNIGKPVTLTDLARVAIIWPAADVLASGVEGYLGAPCEAYQDSWHWEWCDPCWMHLDRMAMIPTAIPEKAAAFRAALKLPRPAAGLCEELTGLNHHVPPVYRRPAVAGPAPTASAALPALYADRPAPPEDCWHRGAQVRIATCELCGAKGRQYPVFACAIHGNCSVQRYSWHQPEMLCGQCMFGKQGYEPKS